MSQHVKFVKRAIVSLVFASAATVAACGGRAAEVRTAPQAARQVTVEVHNTLAQGVNVYVVQGSTKTLLRQVAAGATVPVPVPNITPGTTVRLEATTIDGVRTYSRDNVTLNGTFVFTLP